MGASYSQSRQSSESNQGLMGPEKQQLNYEAHQRSIRNNQESMNAYNSDYGTFQGKTGAQMLGLDSSTGLPAAFGSYLNNVAQNLFGQASAGGAMRGQWSPENTSNLVGQAITNMGATALPYVSDFAKSAATLPEQVRTNRLGFLQASAANDAALLGGNSSYSGSSVGSEAHIW